MSPFVFVCGESGGVKSPFKRNDLPGFIQARLCKIQGIFKAFKCFSSTFPDKFNFQGLFKTVLYIQVLFKPVRTMFA